MRKTFKVVIQTQFKKDLIYQSFKTTNWKIKKLIALQDPSNLWFIFEISVPGTAVLTAFLENGERYVSFDFSDANMETLCQFQIFSLVFDNFAHVFARPK